MTQAKSYVMALDQGTTSSRAILSDSQARMVAMAQREFTQHYPQAGWVEHDATEIWATQRDTLTEVLARCVTVDREFRFSEPPPAAAALLPPAWA